MASVNEPLQNVTDTPEPVMDLLHEHVPLALLCDLTILEGPRSAEILHEEGHPVDAWWQQ